MTSDGKVLIFDTTLRDGEQSPGVALNVEEKLEIARALERMRVDFIEAGFPASSPGDLESVTEIAKEVHGSAIAGLARAVPSDVDACWEAVQHAEHPRIHVFLSSSDIHIMHQLEKRQGASAGDGADDGRAGEEVLRRRRVLPHGRDSLRTRLRLPHAHRSHRRRARRPSTFPILSATRSQRSSPSSCADIQENVPNIDKARISVHCHNDLGLAVANSLAAVTGGRAADRDLRQRHRRARRQRLARRGRHGDQDAAGLLPPRHEHRHARQIHRTSRLVSQLTGMSVQPNKAIVGVNAFRHQSGIHQHGITKMRETYEIIDPADIGAAARDDARPEQELRPPRPQVAPGRPRLRDDQRRTGPRLRRLQGPRRQEGRDR